MYQLFALLLSLATVVSVWSSQTCEVLLLTGKTTSKAFRYIHYTYTRADGSPHHNSRRVYQRLQIDYIFWKPPSYIVHATHPSTSPCAYSYTPRTVISGVPGVRTDTGCVNLTAAMETNSPVMLHGLHQSRVLLGLQARCIKYSSTSSEITTSSSSGRTEANTMTGVPASSESTSCSRMPGACVRNFLLSFVLTVQVEGSILVMCMWIVSVWCYKYGSRKREKSNEQFRRAAADFKQKVELEVPCGADSKACSVVTCVQPTMKVDNILTILPSYDDVTDPPPPYSYEC